jgi:hypothetical protein
MSPSEPLRSPRVIDRLFSALLYDLAGIDEPALLYSETGTFTPTPAWPKTPSLEALSRAD